MARVLLDDAGWVDSMKDPWTLTEIAVKYGSDKYYSHSYIEGFYEHEFHDRKVRHLLEVGIGYEALMKDFTPNFVHGSSLRMWAEFWPGAEIWACDVRPETLINEGRIHSMVADQSSLHDLAKLLEFCGGGWEIVIDDGSHQTEHQIFTCRTLLPCVSLGGLYIIEDVQEPEKVAEAVGGEIWRGTKRADDNLVICRR